MLQEFVQVTDLDTDERYFVNLEDISFIREIKEQRFSVIKLKSKDKMLLKVKEDFDSFEEFFEDLGAD